MIAIFYYLRFDILFRIMEYSSEIESALFRSGALASGGAGEREAKVVSGRAVANPVYVGRFDAANHSELIGMSGSDDKTLTESMAAASISGSAEVVSTYASVPRAPLPRPPPPHLVLFQRGGPQALEMYQAPPRTPPQAPAWNSNEIAEHFVYEGEARPASAPPPTTDEEHTAEYEQELIQVDAVAEETEEEEDGEEAARSLPAWQNPNNKRRARQVVALIDQDVLDAMSTDNLIWIMQAGFQSLMSRRVRH